MPQDFYNLDSAYGTEDQLKTALATLHKYEMYIILDVVLHQFVDSDQACQAAWNKAGTILDSVSLTTPLFCIHSFFIFFCNLLKLYISSHPTLYFVFSFFFSYVRFILYIQDSILVYRSILFRFYYFIIFLFCKDEVSRKRHLYIKTLVLIKDLFSFDHKKYRGSSSLSLAVTQVILQFWYYNND